jgi:hypothetical protein
MIIVSHIISQNSVNVKKWLFLKIIQNYLLIIAPIVKNSNNINKSPWASPILIEF